MHLCFCLFHFLHFLQSKITPGPTEIDYANLGLRFANKTRIEINYQRTFNERLGRLPNNGMLRLNVLVRNNDRILARTKRNMLSESSSTDTLVFDQFALTLLLPMGPARSRRRIPHLFLVLTLLLVFPLSTLGSRPRPHILKKRNPSFSPLSQTSPSFSQLVELSNLDRNLDFNDGESFLSKVLIPRPVGSKNLTKVQGLFVERFTKLGWVRTRVLLSTPL